LDFEFGGLLGFRDLPKAGAIHRKGTVCIFPGMNWRWVGLRKEKNDADFTATNQDAANGTA
jgi:hypothetical protein